LPERQSIQISKISQIAPLPDPPWLLETNKAAAVICAQALISQKRD